MAISIRADDPDAQANVSDDDVHTEDVDIAGEGPYPFTYPPMGKVYGAELRIRGMKETKEKEAYLQDVYMEWLEKGFGPAAWARLLDRIEDDTDPLTPGHLLVTFRALLAAHAARPTTSSNGASPSPWTKTSTVEPSQPESVSATSVPVTSAT
jgi:hypothetical protein